MDLKPKPVLGRAERLVQCDPLQDSDWDSQLASLPGSSFFQGTAWARVLHDTYGHCPFYFCRLADQELVELLPIMEVASPLTGRRGVSLPFTDLCPPPGRHASGGRALSELSLAEGLERRWRYLEFRGNYDNRSGVTPSLLFRGHVIDLEPGPDALFNGFESSMRRGIRKSVQAGLRVEFSNTFDSIRDFYALHCATRRRHGVPPQPFRFFENIARHVLARGHGLVLTAWLDRRPVAAAVFFHYGSEIIYKFGASDFAFQQLRPNNCVMWEAIKRYASIGFRRMHLGRTSLANEGLRKFKLGLGATEQTIEYYRYDFDEREFVSDVDRAEGWVNHVFRLLPPPLLRLAGQVIYPHLS